jgi:hypothetical protein
VMIVRQQSLGDFAFTDHGVGQAQITGIPSGCAAQRDPEAPEEPGVGGAIAMAGMAARSERFRVSLVVPQGSGVESTKCRTSCQDGRTGCPAALVEPGLARETRKHPRPMHPCIANPTGLRGKVFIPPIPTGTNIRLSDALPASDALLRGRH